MKNQNPKFQAFLKYSSADRSIPSLKKSTRHRENTFESLTSTKPSMKTRSLKSSCEIPRVKTARTNKQWLITKERRWRSCLQSPLKIVNSDIYLKNRRPKSNNISININSTWPIKSKLMTSRKRKTSLCCSSSSWTEFLSWRKKANLLPTIWRATKKRSFRRNLTSMNG